MKKLLFIAMVSAALVVACKSNSGKEGKAPVQNEDEPYAFTLGDTVTYETARIAEVKDLRKGYQVSLDFDVQYIVDERIPQIARDSINAWRQYLQWERFPRGVHAGTRRGDGGQDCLVL